MYCPSSATLTSFKWLTRPFHYCIPLLVPWRHAVRSNSNTQSVSGSLAVTLHSRLHVGADFSKVTSESGEGTWYCNVCTSPERAVHEAMSRADAQCHERSYAHTRQVKIKAEKDMQAWLPRGDAAAWDVPEDYNTSWDSWGRVDKMSDYIPFWRDGVQAAERGEKVAKMEDFLERLDREIRERNRSANQWGKDLGLDMWGGGGPTPNAWGAQHQEKPTWEAAEKWDGPESGWGDSGVGNGWGVPGGDAWADDAGGWGVVPDKESSGPDQTGWGVPECDWGEWGPSTATESSGKLGSAPADKARGDNDLCMFVEKVAQEEAASPAKRERLRKFSQVRSPTIVCHHDCAHCVACSSRQRTRSGRFKTSRGFCAPKLDDPLKLTPLQL